MNFDLNTLANFAQMFGKMQNNASYASEQRQNKPQNAVKRANARICDKSYGSTAFVTQNGLGEEIDISAILNNDSKMNSDEGKHSTPLDGILNILNKKNDMEKIMPAIASVFSSKQSDTSKNTPSAQKENKNGKPDEIFNPIEFAGYTALCALNRLYFSIN